MKSWDALYPFVLIDALGCPEPLIDQALRLASREFCQVTKAIREWSDPVKANGGTDVFDFDLSTGSELVQVQRATVNDIDVPIASYDQLPLDPSQVVGRPAQLVQLDQTSFQITPTPKAGDTIAVQLATQPGMFAQVVADDLVNRYADAIAAGAKSRLLMGAGTAWSNPALGGAYRTQFDAYMRVAANEAMLQRKPHRTKLAPL